MSSKWDILSVNAEHGAPREMGHPGCFAADRSVGRKVHVSPVAVFGSPVRSALVHRRPQGVRRLEYPV